MCASFYNTKTNNLCLLYYYSSSSLSIFFHPSLFLVAVVWLAIILFFFLSFASSPPPLFLLLLLLVGRPTRRGRGTGWRRIPRDYFFSFFPFSLLFWKQEKPSILLFFSFPFLLKGQRAAAAAAIERRATYNSLTLPLEAKIDVVVKEHQ